MNDPIEQEARSPAPPTEVRELPPRPSAWPMVLGVIAIVLGALGLLAYGCAGLIGNVAVVVVAELFQSQGTLDPVNAAQMDALRQYLPWNLVVALGSAALAVVLLVGGIGLTRRRRRSRKVLLSWSVLRIVWAVPASIVGYLANSAQFEAMMEAAETSGSPMPGGFFVLMQGLGLAGVAIGLLWAWALPVFMLVWFARGKIRQEVAVWS